MGERELFMVGIVGWRRIFLRDLHLLDAPAKDGEDAYSQPLCLDFIADDRDLPQVVVDETADGIVVFALDLDP